MKTREQINAELLRHIDSDVSDQDYFDGYHDGLKWIRDTAPALRNDPPRVYTAGSKRYQEGFDAALFWVAYGEE